MCTLLIRYEIPRDSYDSRLWNLRDLYATLETVMVFKTTLSRPLISVGLQVRSRAILAYPGYGGEVCPEDLYQSRSCTEGPCVTYTWHASPWRHDTRAVWCESSDGARVSGI